MKYLYYIFRLFITPKCDHDFKIIKETEKQAPENRTIGFLYVIQCKKCGKIEHYEI